MGTQTDAQSTRDPKTLRFADGEGEAHQCVWSQSRQPHCPRTALRLPQPSSRHKGGLQNSHGHGHRAEPTVLLAPEGPQTQLTGREVKAPQAPPARPALGTKGASA